MLAVGLLLVPTLVAAAPRSGGGGPRGSAGHSNHGWGGPRWNNWSGHGSGGHWHGSGGHWHGGGGHWHGGGCCWGWGGFAVGVGVGTLLTAPFWAGYPVYAPYPAYPYPAYPAYPAYPSTYPAYAPGAAYPTTPPPPGPPVYEPSSSMTLTPEPLSSAPGAPPAPGGTSAVAPPQAGCETVTVAGHWETRIYPDGQRLTVWIPTSTRSICR
jgi:hypothetical protein